MTAAYGDLRRQVLSLVRKYSIAGKETPAAYNCQADDLNRIPLLLNEALAQLRTEGKPDTAAAILTGGEEYGGWMRCPLPEDCHALRTGGVTVLRGGRLRRTNDYRLQGKYILVPPGETYTVEYDRVPVQLPLDAAEDLKIVEDPEVLHAAVCYAAAYLVMQEDEFAYAALRNEYERRLSRLSAGVTAEVGTVEDVYGGEGD